MKRARKDMCRYAVYAQRTLRESIRSDLETGIVDEEYLSIVLSALMHKDNYRMRAKLAVLTTLQMSVYTKNIDTGKIEYVAFPDPKLIAMGVSTTERDWKKKNKFDFPIVTVKDGKEVCSELIRIAPYYYKRERRGDLVPRK